MKYKAVIFDCDGTILNTIEDLADSLNYALESFKLPTITYQQACSYIGNGGRKFVERAVEDSSYVEKVLPLFTSYYEQHCQIKTRPYDGIIELIKQLKQHHIKCAVVTNKYDKPANDLTDKYFKDCFDITIGVKENVKPKPSPDSVNQALKILNVSKEESIYIGDSEVDLQTALNAGLDCLSVSYGFRSKQQLIAAGAKNIVDSVTEIMPFLEK